MDRSEIAGKYFLEGYNCAQSVALAFKDLIRISEEDIKKICSPFGGGIGKLREVCGALSGTYIVLGYLKGCSDLDYAKKDKLYKEVQNIAKQFKEQNGFIRCRDLLDIKTNESSSPSKRDANYYASRPCIKIIQSAVSILEKFIS